MDAILSDPHANIEAEETVLRDIDRRKVDRILCLGDVVGYGPNPKEAIKLTEKYIDKKDILEGNHDKAAIEGPTPEYNHHAKRATYWTQNELRTNGNKPNGLVKMVTYDYEGFLKGLQKHAENEHAFMIHDTPAHPNEAKYILNESGAIEALSSIDKKICFVGHLHVPFMFEQTQEGETKLIEITPFQKIPLNKGRYVINVGSVGQPRDRDNRACYVLTDYETIQFIRLDYDFKKTQEKIKNSELPNYLAARLEAGH